MSEYNVKYRPQKIAELDLILVRESLSKVLKSGKIPHAFLFAGPRGTGKTSAARIVAKVVNCLGKPEKGVYPESAEGGRGEPCNECTQCLSITTGNNLDVLEIDAASNRGIDDIRDLREKVKLAPSFAAYKVYIIDEAHMLTNEAFNALLKTLEEPPKHVIFILCTTEPEKLPLTIVSRCTRINFKKAKEEEVVEKLRKIADEEKIEVSAEALVEVAKGAGGSFRDALKILELATFAGEKIEPGQIKEILGQTTGLVPEKLLEAMFAHDTEGAIAEINRVVESGANLRIYTTQVLELLRGVMLGKLGIDFERETANTEALKLSETLKIEEIKTLIELFSRAAQDLKEAIIPQLPLELAVVEWAGNQTQENKENQEHKEYQEKKEPEKMQKPFPPENSSSSSFSSSSLSFVDIQSRWQELLSAVRPRNFSIEAFLRACRPIDFDGRILTIEVFYEFHRDKLESERCRSIVEEVANELFGAPLGLKYILGERPKKVEPKNEEEAEPGKVVLKNVVLQNEDLVEDQDIMKVAEEIFNGKPN